nr:receptor-like protein 7 [Ziziphus jujuba var. spinosa]
MGLTILLLLFLKLSLLYEIVIADHDHYSFTSMQLASCHEDEKLALLKFKDSFLINRSASGYEGGYPKVLQWNNPQQGETSSGNCCSWDGVECDEETGNVVGLDLSSSCLYGTINSTSTLYNLVHLRRLNLSDNHFNYSLIPTSMGQFSEMTHLDLSASAFSGQVPIEISNMSNLSSLDLSENYLELKNPNMRSLVQNLSTGLEILNLNHVLISSEVPDFLANFTSLTFLGLYDCELQGEFPAKIFQLPNLQNLYIGANSNLSGYLPEFLRASPLKILNLEGTRFSGSLPSSIQMLDSLQLLFASQCHFSGPIPSSIGKLTQLTKIYLAQNSLNGSIPSSLQNLTQLTHLALEYNQMTGPIPSSLRNLTQLIELRLNVNKFHGSIPQWLSKLNNLKFLALNYNNLGGRVKFNMFFNMESLTDLQIGHNNLTLLFDEKGNVNATLAKFTTLGLSSCNLIEFPDFLWHQNKLEMLVVESNGLRGPLPIPPPSIKKFLARDNMLRGEISPLYCNLASLDALSLSDNMLSGTIPGCFENFTLLSLLDLRNNSFHGIIPEICKIGGNLEMINLSDNQLQGHLPRSLSNCMMLQVLAISNNQLNDVFPSWLGSLPKLRLLTLRRNWFHSIIGEPENDMQFPKLQVIDLSYNNFTGELPSQYISNWNSMKVINNISTEVTYMNSILHYIVSGTTRSIFTYLYVITITHKGVERYRVQIQDNFAAIDLSCNRFEGKIPILIGNLKALRSLNLSNNILTGHIPLALENLNDLESLDISQNSLSGAIPQQLSQLGFLSIFNVSHNNLTGPIPHGKQFDAFDNTSFEGNPGLCGALLSKKCENSMLLPPPNSAFEKDDGDSVSQLKLDWKFVLAGYTSGLVVGIVLSDFVIPFCHDVQFKESISFECGVQGVHLKVLQWESEGESSNCYLWDGILCDEKIGHVISFDLKNPDLKTLLRNLTRLETLILSYVNVSSIIADLLANFTSLTTLMLREWPIPSSLDKLTQLTTLDLGSNNFSGYILSSLRNLTRLSSLRVDDNQISGPLPSWLGNLTKLNALDLSRNEFYGPIPQSLSILVNLEVLSLTIWLVQ